MILFIILTGYTSSFSKIHDSPFCRVALKDILQLEFDKAQIQLKIIAAREPSNNFRLLIENYHDFVKVNVRDDYWLYLDYKERMAQRIAVVEDDDAETPYYRWVLGDLYFQQGILKLKFGEYLSGARSVKKSLDLLTENKKLYPDFIYNNKYLGIMHAAISSIPPEYQWISSLLGFEGTLVQGEKELEVLLRSNLETDPFVSEAKMLYLFTLMTFDNPERVENKVTSAINMLNERNPLESFFICSASFKLNKNEDVLNILSKVEKSEFPYLHYMSGVAYLNKLEYLPAKKELIEFVNKGSGQNYYKSAVLKLAWTELLSGNEIEYKRYLKMIPLKGSLSTDEDKLAMSASERIDAPIKELLKARLLFDGGYFGKAESLLESSKGAFSKESDIVEFNYRMGRILHRSGELEEAQKYYRETLEKDPKSNTWFTTSAALQIALINEEEKDFKKAEKYFKKCLSLDPPQYKASLHQKAKAGLHRVR